MEANLKKLLQDGAAEFGIKLDETAISGFDLFMAELLEYNKVINLTKITEPEEIVIKHYLDSLSLLRCTQLPQGASLVDVGCGAGFPGIPLKLVRGDIRLTSIDSLNKRIKFLEGAVASLGLKQCACFHLRAEEACRKQELRGTFDVVTARAVAGLSTLVEICLPLLKTGGVFLAMKGPNASHEAEEAKNAIALLGGRLEDIREFTLPGSDIGRTVIVIRKFLVTKDIYPRQTARISKNPL